MDLHTHWKSHRTLLFSIFVLYSFSISAHFCAFIVASPSFVPSLVSPSASVCGDDFLLDTNSNFFHRQPLTTETLHVASLSLLLFQYSRSCSGPVSHPHFLLSCLFLFLSQGRPDASRHPKATGLHTLCVHLGHTLPHWCHPDAVRGCVHPCWRLHRTGTALWGQEVQRLARSAVLCV